MKYFNIFRQLSEKHTRRDEIYLTILNLGLHRIRGAASQGDFRHCELESDHLHNIPRYLAEPETAQHGYYYLCERALYLKRVDRAREENQSQLATYEKLWAELEGLIPFKGTPWENDWKKLQKDKIKAKMEEKYPQP